MGNVCACWALIRLKLKPKAQPFAKEAKAFVQRYCRDHAEIFLKFEKGSNQQQQQQQQQQDHYGRWLAHIYVKEDEHSFVCVNEALVAAGLANVYRPNTHNKPLANWDTLVRLQTQARKSELGVWNRDNNNHNWDKTTTVYYKTKNGAAYHVRSCQHIANAIHLTPLTGSQAADMGLHPCRSCLGD
mmetsp:Transcript_17778/g.33504  ORF Transcript_17778/g.33504 Transcript_17778/m.33504 type:complete len:186 (-) Transcript_17778:279-836(-)|eukprot:scaffold6072_cov94-Amphora_coffeaeformis.AAC.2